MQRRFLVALRLVALLALLAITGCLASQAPAPDASSVARPADPSREPAPEPSSERRLLGTETFEDEVPVGVASEQLERSATWRSDGRLDVPAGTDLVLLQVQWDSSDRSGQELNLTLCLAHCGGRSATEVVEHVAGPSPLRIQVDPHPGNDVHWRVTAASTLVVGQPFVGEVSFLAASPTVPEPEVGPDTSDPLAEETVAAPHPGSQRAWALGVSLTLAWLLAALQRLAPYGVTLSTRFDPHELPDHPDRARILEEVRADPGVHYRALQRRLGIGRGILGHHLRLLLQANLLVEHRGAGHRCFHLPGTSTAASRDGLAVLRSERARSLLQAICAKPGVTSAELAEATGLARATISHHLARLRRASLVASRTAGRRRPLTATELGRRLLGRHG